MSNTIIDRRKNLKGKSIPNRRRFLERVQKNVRKSIDDLIDEHNITDIKNKTKKRTVRINRDDLKEPKFIHDPETGRDWYVLPGNKDFIEGDTIPKPPSGGGGEGGGPGASEDGEGEDDFIFDLTYEEFLDYFFEALALPDLVKKSMVKMTDSKRTRAGYTRDGSPSQLSLIRTMRQAKGRRIALTTKKKKYLEQLIEQYDALVLKLELSPDDQEIIKQLEEIETEIEKITKQLKSVRFLEEDDLRYKHWQLRQLPTTHAVMFCVLDVSASVDEYMKRVAKAFFMLVYLFLTTQYSKVDIVFIRHHTRAEEVSEKEFFYGRATGGTIVSSALELVKKIIDERYSPEYWNIYITQCSDGDNWPMDDENVEKYMDQLLPIVQYFAYVEVGSEYKDDEAVSDLWELYTRFALRTKKFQMKKAYYIDEVYPVLLELFKKEN